MVEAWENVMVTSRYTEYAPSFKDLVQDVFRNAFAKFVPASVSPRKMSKAAKIDLEATTVVPL